jgi:spore germination cell wall hydrolase CwlJ-like protein
MNALIGGVVAVSLLIPQIVASITPQEQPHARESKSGITLATDESGDPSRQKRDAEEILWLARALYSETKNEDEMHLVGWVIRNRVENNYWGDTTYEEVVLRKNQFSGLNAGDKQFAHNISLEYDHTYDPWMTAVKVATEVYYASDDERPFSKDVQHFYSPKIVAAPKWADVDNHAFTTKDNTFAFYQGVR